MTEMDEFYAAERVDLFKVLDLFPEQASEVLLALQEGRVDGLTYFGPCACLIGTIGKAKYGKAWVPPFSYENSADAVHKQFQEFRGIASPHRPIERWFTKIGPNELPHESATVRLTIKWIEEWMAARKQ